MPDELRLLLAFGLAFACALIAVPLAIRVAWATDFLDHPRDYKKHGRATPYLGGAAVMAAFLPVALLLGAGGSAYGEMLACAAVLAVVGTLDDRTNLGPASRLLMEIAAALVLWVAGFGWQAFEVDALNALLTVFWVVGLVNAFNLMDNQDGAAGTVGAVCALGAGAFAIAEGHPLLGAVAFALAGSCAGFLPFNLANPARIFLGDGGSMPVGFVVAAVIMAVSPHAGLGAAAVPGAALLVALPILDTTLVVFSRRRRGVAVLSGGRDHLTHRLLRPLGSARAVAAVLCIAQAIISVVALALLQTTDATVFTASGIYLVLGAAAILALEWPYMRDSAAFTEPAQQESTP